MKRVDGPFKIVFLIFMTAFFEFFFIYTFKRYFNHCIFIAFLDFIKTSNFRHKIFSLIIFCICIIILIISEYCFQDIDGIVTIKDLTFAILFIILSHISIAFDDVKEKYIIVFDFINPFFILICQGIIGLIF